MGETIRTNDLLITVYVRHLTLVILWNALTPRIRYLFPDFVDVEIEVWMGF